MELDFINLPGAQILLSLWIWKSYTIFSSDIIESLNIYDNFWADSNLAGEVIFLYNTLTHFFNLYCQQHSSILDRMWRPLTRELNLQVLDL